MPTFSPINSKYVVSPFLPAFAHAEDQSRPFHRDESLHGFSRRLRSISGVEGGEARRDEGQKASNRPPKSHPGKVVIREGLRLGGVRSAGLLHQIIALEAMLFGCLGTALALNRGFPVVPNGRENLWLASSAAGLVISSGAFAILVSGKVWLPAGCRFVQSSGVTIAATAMAQESIPNCAPNQAAIFVPKRVKDCRNELAA